MSKTISAWNRSRAEFRKGQVQVEVEKDNKKTTETRSILNPTAGFSGQKTDKISSLHFDSTAGSLPKYTADYDEAQDYSSVIYSTNANGTQFKRVRDRLAYEMLPNDLTADFSFKPYNEQKSVAGWDIVATYATILQAAKKPEDVAKVDNEDFDDQLAEKLQDKNSGITVDMVAAAYFTSPGKGKLSPPPANVRELIDGLKANKKFAAKIMPPPAPPADPEKKSS
jgi:hypothetical protein